MRVFVTGASGWIGSAAVDELLATGHEVTGLARSNASAATLAAKGVRVRRGDLDDLDSLRAGASDADAVLHLANKHDFVNPAISNAAERAAVQTIGDTLAGSGRPFLLASGVAGLSGGRPATEDDPSPFHGPDSPRGGAENLAFEFVDRGVRTVSLRFAPTVHGVGDHGFIAAIAGVARAKGVSGYPGDGTNRWAAVHRSDAAPGLAPRLWYGMPAYAKDGKVLCFFQPAKKFKSRYATLGFNDVAALDDGAMWPCAYALTTLTAADEKKVRALIARAAG